MFDENHAKKEDILFVKSSLMHLFCRTCQTTPVLLFQMTSSMCVLCCRQLLQPTTGAEKQKDRARQNRIHIIVSKKRRICRLRSEDIVTTGNVHDKLGDVHPAVNFHGALRVQQKKNLQPSRGGRRLETTGPEGKRKKNGK
ncbi:hypothetical protein RUM43_009294 [Polyplax serrata]|uniref:Uncharacterized protein n=1 Tax=Polyplax serrata TaxID=468196 RepID=A0AAN8NVU8_POLSC